MNNLLRKALLIALLAISVNNLVKVYLSLQEPLVWSKDLRQDWLQAKAIFDGLTAYIELPLLTARYIGQSVAFNEFPSPTLHPPFALLICRPMALYSFPVVAKIWSLVEFIAWLLSLWLLWREIPIEIPHFKLSFLTLLLLSFAWYPVSWSMVLGQFALIQNLLFVAAFVSLRRKKDMAGGAFIGIALALKLSGWPLILWLLLEKRFKALVATVVSWTLCHIAAAAVVSPSEMVKYYLEVGPQGAKIYGGHILDISIFSAVGRIFSGIEPKAMVGLHAPPLVAAPHLVSIFSWGTLLIAIFLAFIAVRKVDRSDEKRLDLGFALFCCLSILANPLAWGFYLVLALVSLWVILHEMKTSTEIKPISLWLAIVSGMFLAIPQIEIYKLLLRWANNRSIHPLLATISLIPFFGLLLLYLLLVYQSILHWQHKSK